MTMNQCTMETRYKTTTKKESSKTIIVINEDKDTTYIDIQAIPNILYIYIYRNLQ